MPRRHVFIDFEASSLSTESYPISVGLHEVFSGDEGYCIISPASVLEWTEWSYEAQKIHKLAKPYIEEDGVSPKDAIKVIAEACGDPYKCILIADSERDEFWLKRLYDAAGERCPYVIKNVGRLANGYNRTLLALALSSKENTHHALEDARILAEAVLTLGKANVKWYE
ncbi:hypothetical protein ACMXYX_17800 (plasmid) [Neptuniibacter sp. QD72_48]|uniref:hypothetical protein n=1 Tax=Neptuniibacter sp. QD72_48 TaxID=3398214 RepID=UPI0039F5E8F7